MMFKKALPIAAFLMLAGCKPEMALSLASATEKLPMPRFNIEEVSRRGERPRYDTVQLLDENGTVLWHLRAEPFGDMNSVASIEYGTAPSGFVEVVADAQLVPEKEYTLDVSGTARGQLSFRADAAGLVKRTDE